MNKQDTAEVRFKFRVWDILAKKMRSWREIFNFPAWEIFPGTPEQRAYEVMRYTGKEDMDGKEVYEGDIIKNDYPDHNAVLMEIKYGTYQAYCPVDKVFMDSVGFYAVAEGYPDMPIGTMEGYAIVIGNIYENPELLHKEVV